jgi:hypothetical protein
MLSDDVRDLLNKPLGYEIVAELVNSKMGFNELKSSLPYDHVHDESLDRALDDLQEGSIIIIPPTRGGKKYALNGDLFTSDELQSIKWRARERSNDTSNHMDGPNFDSKFREVDETVEFSDDSEE